MSGPLYIWHSLPAIRPEFLYNRGFLCKAQESCRCQAPYWFQFDRDGWAKVRTCANDERTMDCKHRRHASFLKPGKWLGSLLFATVLLVHLFKGVASAFPTVFAYVEPFTFRS